MVVDIYCVIEHAKYGYVSTYSKQQGFSYNNLACAMTFDSIDSINKFFECIDEESPITDKHMNQFEIKIKIRKV